MILTLFHWIGQEPYEYIEQNGAVSPEGIHDQVQLESDRIHDILMEFTCDGTLTKYNGKLQVVLGDGLETTHRLDGTVVTVRPTRQEDLPAITDTIRQVIANTLYPCAEHLTVGLARDGVLTRHNDAETRVFFVPTVDDRIVGWLHVGASTLQRAHRTVELTLGVRTEYRGRGIGSRLLERGCEWAASNTYQKACQRLPVTNERALSFLESHNWETEAIRRNRYDCHDERTDEVLLAIEL